MKKIISIMVAICLLYTNVFAEYFHIDLPDNNSLEGTGLEYYTTDTSAVFDEYLDNVKAINKQWDNISDEAKEFAAKIAGTTVEEINKALASNAYTATGVGKSPFAINFGWCMPLINQAVLDEKLTGKWNYNKNLYQVRTETFKPTAAALGKCYFTDREFKVLYNVCNLFKLDYLLVLSKWNYQSGNCIGLENTTFGYACGMAGNLGGSGLVTDVQQFFTDEEINSCTNCVRAGGVKNSVKKMGTLNKDMGNMTYEKVIEMCKIYGLDPKMFPPEVIFYVSSSNNATLDKIKMGFAITHEITALLASYKTEGKGSSARSDIKDDLDKNKCREIWQKDEWSNDDLIYLFGDPKTLIGVSEYDNWPDYKKQAYILMKHWSGGSNDSAATSASEKQIVEYIKSKDFNLDNAKKYLNNIYSLWCHANIASGPDAVGNCVASTAVYNYAAPNGNGLTIAPWGVNKEAAMKMTSATQVVLPVNEVFTNEFDSIVNNHSLYKALLYAGMAFDGEFGTISTGYADNMGLSHAGCSKHQIYLNDKNMGYPVETNEEDCNVGGSWTIYFSMINFFYGDGNVIKR